MYLVKGEYNHVNGNHFEYSVEFSGDAAYVKSHCTTNPEYSCDRIFEFDNKALPVRESITGRQNDRYDTTWAISVDPRRNRVRSEFKINHHSPQKVGDHHDFPYSEYGRINHAEYDILREAIAKLKTESFSLGNIWQTRFDRLAPKIGYQADQQAAARA